MVLDLSNIVEKDSKSRFNLVGIVKRMIDKKGNEYYCSIYLDPYQNSWFINDANKLSKIKDPKEHSRGMVMLLFYSSIDDLGL